MVAGGGGVGTHIHSKNLHSDHFFLCVWWCVKCSKKKETRKANEQSERGTPAPDSRHKRGLTSFQHSTENFHTTKKKMRTQKQKATDFTSDMLTKRKIEARKGSSSLVFGSLLSFLYCLFNKAKEGLAEHEAVNYTIKKNQVTPRIYCYWTP